MLIICIPGFTVNNPSFYSINKCPLISLIVKLNADYIFDILIIYIIFRRNNISEKIQFTLDSLYNYNEIPRFLLVLRNQN